MTEAVWQERFYQAFHGNAAAMVIATLEDLRILDVNPAWTELFGCSRDEAAGKTSLELGLIDPEVAARRVADHARNTAGFEAELPLRTRDGRAIVVLASARPIRIAEGTCTLTTLIDITARKQAEEAFSVIFRSTPAGMVLVEDSTDAIVAVNDRLLAMMELRADELVGRSVGEVSFIYWPERRELLGQIQRTGGLKDVELQLAKKSGGGTWALASTEIVTVGSARHRLSVFTDITARKAAEAALRELNVDLERRVADRTGELERTNRDLESFTSSVSHDLRAPLRAIHGFSAILQEDFAPQLPAEAARLLGRIHDSAGRMRDLIDGLLSFSRLGNELHRVEIDLEPLVRSVIDELLAARAIDRLDLTLGPLGTCCADASLVRTVWTNLIDNALKYARNRPRIAIEIGRDDQGAYFIADNGVGFDPAHAHRLFGVFQRLHAGNEFEGTGIGLANVRRIIERHGGRIWATSVPDRGSRFSFTLG